MRAAAFLLALTGALTAAPAGAAEPVVLFHKLCITGEARFARGEVSQIERGGMPRALRRLPRPMADEKIYRISGGAPAFLIVQSGGAEHACSLIEQDGSPTQLIAAMLGHALVRSELVRYESGQSFRQAMPDGVVVSVDTIPPNYALATVRQRGASTSAAPTPGNH